MTVRGERGAGVTRQIGTKYVFAGTQERSAEVGTKVCPRCGRVLFEDMDTCFDCLYSFERDARDSRSPVRASGARVVDALSAVGLRHEVPAQGDADDPLSVIELDEIDDMDEVAATAEDGYDDDEPMANARHRKRGPSSAEDTMDLTALELTRVAKPTASRVRVIACTNDMQVSVPVPKRGLTVGRGEDNDIVLKSRCISRQHLLLVPEGDGVLVEDRGATNPATIRGEPIEGSARVGVGELVVLCDATLRIEEAHPDPAA